MEKKEYKKPALTYDEQIERLQNRGLSITNTQKAFHLLENISYYRLSGYWYPMLEDKVQHTFKPDADFDTAFKIYCFDRELRKMIGSEIEKIEIAIRAKMIYILSGAYGGFWFTDACYFKNPTKHRAIVAKIREEYKRSDEDFIKSFQNKYTNLIPPAWMVMEVTTFGTVSKLYDELRPSTEKRKIANYFGLSEKVFVGWLHSLVYLRNLCAHHSRVWNRTLSIRPLIPHSPKKPWLSNTIIGNNKIFFMLSVIKFFLCTVNPKSTFGDRLRKMLATYTTIDVCAMGFPENWKNQSLWK